MPVQSPWSAFSPYQLFGDHVPMDGFSLVVRLAIGGEAVEQMIGARASEQDALDPELAGMMVRAGIGLIRTPAVSFVYVNTDEAVVLLRGEAVAKPGQSLVVHDHLVSSLAARVALISGEWLPVVGEVYEFPDIDVVRKAFASVIDDHEQHAPLRAVRRLAVQLRARGEAPPDVASLESLEGQTRLLGDYGVDINALPGWWWRGIGARSVDPRDLSQIQLWSDLPSTDELVGLID